MIDSPSFASVLVINGGIPLNGTVAASGNKNAVLPMIAAALLTDQPVHLHNVPDIGDVATMLAIADALGVEVDRDRSQGTLTLTARNLNAADMPAHLFKDIRAGVLFAAPLIHRLGAVQMPPPGGDVIGRRRLDAHFLGLQALGATCEMGTDLVFSASRLRGAEIFLPEASVTATEHLLMAACLAEGRTVIRNCACEPHVQDLATLLTRMGACIQGAGTNILTVDGVPELHGAQHRAGADFAEVGSLLALGAATGGNVTVTGTDAADYDMMRHVYSKLGIELMVNDGSVTVAAEQKRRISPDPRGGIPQIDDGPWPHFPSDAMSVTIVLATQLEGTVLFFEKMYESRMYFVDRLISMGANAVICDPHRVVVSGPARLQGIELSSPDIRAGIALLGAALCASGTSIIRNVRFIDRGYESIETKLRELGADIVRDER